MKESRRRAVGVTLASLLVAGAAQAQFGGRQRGSDFGSGSGSRGRGKEGDSAKPARTAQDPSESIVRELPSLRVDLKLTPEQGPAFDGFERQMRELADVARDRARHVEGYRHDDGSSVRADDMLETLSNDDASRAEASKLAHERLQTLYALLDRDQRKQFDRRIAEALHDPLGSG